VFTNDQLKEYVGEDKEMKKKVDLLKLFCIKILNMHAKKYSKDGVFDKCVISGNQLPQVLIQLSQVLASLRSEVRKGRIKKRKIAGAEEEDDDEDEDIEFPSEP
jgi:hypothetical protein